MAAGYTQEQLATALGVAQQTIAKWEQGRSTPNTLGQMRDVAALLGALPAVLFPDVLPVPVPAVNTEGRCCTCRNKR